MDLTILQSILTIGENVAVEFKRCGNGIETDTYETVCSFLNRFGGDILLGVQDNGEVHSYKKVIYDRVDDADVKVTATGAIAQMYIRKQGIFTEKKIYPYATLEDLRLDLLPKIRIMAKNHVGGNHPWTDMTDMELLQSVGLYGRNIVTGEGTGICRR